jgi:uncharacterized protein
MLMLAKNGLQVVFPYVMDLLSQLPVTLYFHNAQHTLDVLDAVTEIGKHSNISADNLLILKIAALFHDTGYLYTYKGHEESGKLIAGDFLTQHEYHPDVVKSVLDCIDATKMPQAPDGFLQEIICDADLFHFSRSDYPVYAARLRREWEIHLPITFSDKEWAASNLKVLEKHHFFTEYGRNTLQPRKQSNIEKMKKAASGIG